MSRLRLGAATLASVAVLLAGCASNSTKTLTGPTETTAKAPGTTESAADGSATTADNGDTNTTTAADNSAATTTQEITPASGDAIPGLGGKCKEKFASYLAKVRQLGSAPNAYKDLVPVLNELLAGAPADVQAAAKPTLDAFGTFATLIDKYNGDIAKASQDPDFAAAEQAMSSADAQAASKKIDDWLKSTCGG